MENASPPNINVGFPTLQNQMKERHVRGLGRLILKEVSKIYLEKDNK